MSVLERWSPGRAAAWLRRPVPEDHKYRRGVLAVRTGSVQYPGAAVIGVSAAWRTGVGMVRYVPPFEDAHRDLPAPAAAVLARHPETVLGEGRCDAWLLGSGTDPSTRTASEEAAIFELLRSGIPTVVDAGALDLVSRFGDTAGPVILTPHLGEFERLHRGAPLPDDGSPSSVARRGRAAVALAAELGTAVLLKGSVSICAGADGRAIAHGPSTPWLATAGTGDALAGILGALVAAHAERLRERPTALVELGATAALLHDSAARIAASDPAANGAGSPITALDVVAAVPRAFRTVSVAGTGADAPAG